MANQPATASLIGGITLLERAITYTLGALHAVRPEALSNPTPCAEWDLRALLRHMDDSLAALHEAVDDGRVSLHPADAAASGPGASGRADAGPGASGPAVAGPGGDAAASDPGGVPEPARRVRDHACRVLGAWTNGGGADLVAVAGCPVTATIVAGAGAVEIAVHGWDVAEACGQPWPIPAELAEEMLALVPLFVTEADRPARFAAPVAPAPDASPSDRLVAFLGRRP